MARARRGRRRKDDHSAVTREEFNALAEMVSMIDQKAMFGRGIAAVPGGGAAGDDGYEPTFPGTINNANTVGGFPPEDIPYITDGAAPDSSPTPTVQGGLGFLNVKWAGVANPDNVTYEVHLSTDPGFDADATTLVGETPGLQYFVRKDADDALLLYDTDYYVKIIAKDEDDAAAESTVSAAEQLDPAGQDDILAGAITAEKLETVMALATSMIAGDPTAERVEMGIGTDGAGALDTEFRGVRAYGYIDAILTNTFYLDGDTGNSYIKGRLDFGDGSRIEDDIIEFYEQTTSGYATAAIVQSAMKTSSGGGGGTITPTFPVASTPGNAIYVCVGIRDPDGTAPAAPTTPAGYTLVGGELGSVGNAGADLYQYIYVKDSVTAPTTSVTVTLGDTGYYVGCILEVSGVVPGIAGVDEYVDAQGSDGSAGMSTGSTLTLDQAEEFAIGFIMTKANYVNETPTGGFSFVKRGTASDAGSMMLGLALYQQAINATTALALSDTSNHVGIGLDSTPPWISALFSVKRSTNPANPNPGVADHFKVYARDDNGETRLFGVAAGGPSGAGLYHSLTMPPGCVLPFAGGTAPLGFLLCYGQSLLRSDYPALFGVIGTTYGSADGTHFNLPDMRGRIPVTLDNMGGSDAARLSMANTLGGVGGLEEVTLTASQSGLRSHTHSLDISQTNTATGGGSTRVINGGGAGNTGAASIGGDPASVAHTNLQPYILMNAIISY